MTKVRFRTKKGKYVSFNTKKDTKYNMKIKKELAMRRRYGPGNI